MLFLVIFFFIYEFYRRCRLHKNVKALQRWIVNKRILKLTPISMKKYKINISIINSMDWSTKVGNNLWCLHIMVHCPPIFCSHLVVSNIFPLHPNSFLSHNLLECQVSSRFIFKQSIVCKLSYWEVDNSLSSVLLCKCQTFMPTTTEDHQTGSDDIPSMMRNINIIQRLYCYCFSTSYN